MYAFSGQGTRFEEGASVQIKLSTGETVPGEVRVSKAEKGGDEEGDLPQTGLRALINGQSHANRVEWKIDWACETGPRGSTKRTIPKEALRNSTQARGSQAAMAKFIGRRLV